MTHFDRRNAVMLVVVVAVMQQPVASFSTTNQTNDTNPGGAAIDLPNARLKGIHAFSIRVIRVIRGWKICTESMAPVVRSHSAPRSAEA